MAADLGQGTTISFGSILTNASNTTTFKVTGISWSGIMRDVVESSHMLTTGGKEYIASETYDPGDLSVDILFDPTVNPLNAITNVATNQVVFVRFSNGGTAAGSTSAWSANGYLSAFDIGVPRDALMTGTCKIKLSGNIGI